MHTMTKGWLRQFQPRTPFERDFVEDALGDSLWPSPGTRRELLGHLRSRRACREALAAACSVWRAFAS